MEGALVSISFEKENIFDLLRSRDLTTNGLCELSNISTDKRCLRETKQFYVSEIDFDSAFQLRVFTLNDVVQFKIKDISE
jgi:hypothetical protein